MLKAGLDVVLVVVLIERTFFGVALGLLPTTGLLGLATVPLAVPAFIGARRYAEDSERLTPALRMNVLTSILTPALLLQVLTTREPDDRQLEVAISALKGALDADAE